MVRRLRGRRVMETGHGPCLFHARCSDDLARRAPSGLMRVSAIIYADEDRIRDMDDKVYEQAVNEEVPSAYKDVGAVVAVAERAGLARRVARLRPLICVKG
jgi:RNA-splicing ligase RtcB